MKIFSLLETSYGNFTRSLNTYLNNVLSSNNTSYNSSSIFGQLIKVVSSVMQNIMLYIEDAMVEQNKYTAQRKKSIYGLAKLSGYNPSLGTASGVQIRLTYIPNNEEEQNIIIKNKEKLTCSQNGLQYNIILPQEAIIMNIEQDNNHKYFYAVQGRFETQTFVSKGGKLYTQNVVFPGDTDIEYLEVYINDKKWERKDSLYDMNCDAEQFVCNTSLYKGFDLLFGNDQYGRSLKEGDVIKVNYLLHDGELGNINFREDVNFTFNEPLRLISGDEVDGNNVFLLTLALSDNSTSGTNSEDKLVVKNMIGCNSRSLVLASPENYKQFINKFSFCGYNRTWSERGSLEVKSLILKNYTNNLKEGKDYFSLKEKDYILSPEQKQTIINCIKNSGNQLAGVTYNICDPELYKYAIYAYIKLKSKESDQNHVSDKLRQVVGNFFSNIPNDFYIPKSDIVKIIKESIPEIDGVDIYFLSEKNEKALIQGYYEKKEKIFNPSTNTYDIRSTTVYLYDGEDPGLGMDEHGNIYLENDEQFPVIMGGWEYKASKDSKTTTRIDYNEPLIITYY
jgi:hypothetical protein